MKKKQIPDTDVLMEILQKLINNAWNIRDHIHQPSIDRWLDNFTGEALCNDEDIIKREEAAKLEKQLALFLLCNFVYYNEDEIKYLTKVMLDKYIHNVFTSEGKKIVTNIDYNNLIKKTQFTFLGNISESSSYLLYLFRQENDLSKECFEENDTTENIVFIEDFSITGTQAIGYLNKKMFSYLQDTNKNIFVLLMITTDEALKELNKINNVTVLPCIVLDDKSKVFSDSSIIFTGYDDYYKNMARKMCEYYGSKITKNCDSVIPLGYGNGGYIFGAYYNIPDNTLPIFWSSQSDWNYLFKRYEKKYNIDWMTLGGRYV